MTDQAQDTPPPPSMPGFSFKAGWRQLPLYIRVTGVLCGMFILLTVSHVLATLFGGSSTDTGYEKLKIAGETAERGIYDPSVAFATDTAAWLAYSVVKTGKDAANPMAEVHLALSQDAGKNWNYGGQPVFTSRNETLYQPDGATPLAEGIARYEGPGLIYDPADKGREWKIFAYRYFWNGDVDLASNTAVIALKYASDPMGKWSDEIWLFSARPGIPPPPYDRLVLLSLSRLSPALADVTSFSEPAPFLYDGNIYLLMTAFTGKDQPTRLVLIGSKDHGNSWYYIGSPLSFKDLGKKEITRVSGGSLVELKGKIFLLAGFGNDHIRSLGAHVFEIADLSLGKLKQDSKTGLPFVVDQISPKKGIPLAGLGAGSAHWDSRLAKGVMISQMESASSGVSFNIFYTLRKIGQKD